MLWRVQNCVKVEKTDRLLIKKRKNNMGRNFNRESVQKSQMLRMNGWITSFQFDKPIFMKVSIS